MPRRKKHIIKYFSINKEMRELIVGYLGFNHDLQDCDLMSMEIHFKEKLSYKIRNVDTAIYNLENYIAKNSRSISIVNGHQYVTKKDLAKMLKVSRPTLDRWIESGFINGYKALGTLIYPPDKIIEQLKKYKKSIQTK